MKTLLCSEFMKSQFPFGIMHIRHDHRKKPVLHAHEFVELIYVVNGRAQHRFEKEIKEVRSGDVIIIPPGRAHRYDINPGEYLELINCLFVPKFLSESILRGLDPLYSSRWNLFDLSMCLAGRSMYAQHLCESSSMRVHRLLETMEEELQFRENGYETMVCLELMELMILLSVSRASTHAHSLHHEQNVLRIVEYLKKNYAEKLDLSSLAVHFNFSVRHMSRIFKEVTGMTVVKKLQNIRIEAAKKLLAETDLTAVRVAELVGYNDPSFFNRLFMSEVGCSPKKYRASRACTVFERGLVPYVSASR